MLAVIQQRAVRFLHKITGYRLADPAKRLRYNIRRKRWTRAARVVDVTGVPIDAWLQAHILRCAEKEKAFRNIILPRRYARDRIRRLDSTYSLVATAQVYAGTINMGAFVHEIRTNPKGSKRYIFEKVLHPKTLPQVELEDLLFREMAHEALLAPEYLGFLSTDGFLSAFYEYKEGGRPSREEGLELAQDAVLKLWRSLPSKTLLEVAEDLPLRRKDQVARHLRPDHLARFLSAVVSEGELRLAEALAARYLDYVMAFRAMPSFILHEDISASNMIRSHDGVCYLIDWDKWCVSHVGAGLKLEPQDYLNAPLSAKLSEFTSEVGKLSPRDIWRNVAIDNLARCLGLGSWNAAIAWTRHVLSSD